MTTYREQHTSLTTTETMVVVTSNIIWVSCVQPAMPSAIDQLGLSDYRVYPMTYHYETAPAIVEATIHGSVDAVFIHVADMQTYAYDLCYQLRHIQALTVPLILVGASLNTAQRIRGLKMGASLCVDLRKKTAEVQLLIERQIETYRQMRHLQADSHKQQIKFETQLTLKEEFVQTVSHNLKNPLSIIYGSALLLQQQGNIPDANDREMLANILSAVSSIRKLLSNLHNLSRFEDAQKFACERLPFLDFLSNCTESFHAVAKNGDVELTYESLSPDCSVEFDRDSMIQAISNLIANAIKYTPAGGKIRVSGMLADNGVKVTVADTGIGIAHDALPHIFERFYRARASAQQYRGSGLGLAISKAIIEQHNGTIDAASKLGEGTTFIVTLPLQQN
jgi:signal transduction histidine kinase